MAEPVLVMEDIKKSFPSVLALSDAKLRVYKGEAMALIGENGAGKSTLMKILTGTYKKDAGEVRFKGRSVDYINSRKALEDGIAIIRQELNLIPKMTIYENIFLGSEVKGHGGVTDRKYMIARSKELLEMVKTDLDPCRKVETLSIAQQQMVEIAKVLLYDAQIIVMDEPTDALPDEEVDSLFAIMRELKKQDKGIIYISHRLKEIFEICERVTVMRDGKFINENKVDEITNDELVEMMVGRTLQERFPHIEVEPGNVVMQVENVTNQYVKDVSFQLRAGEILGISGLVGSGRTELAKTIYGCYPYTEGQIHVNGKKLEINSISKAIQSGVYYMTEDRKQDGLIMQLDVRTNMTLSSLQKISILGKMRSKQEKLVAEDYRERVRVKTPSIYQRVINLSGGNQQKVVLARALLTQPEVLILDEPTRGIDVGTKKEIYNLINEQKAQGRAIIIISSEMPEILGMSDRILVMNEGRVKGELAKAEASQEKIMKLILY